MKHVTLCALLAGLLPLSSTCAEEIKVHGFVAQGLTQSLNSSFITNNEEITGELTELGINARYTINSNLALVGQGVYLDGGNRYDKGGRVDYLFVDWQLPRINDWKVRVNLGRFKNRHWLYSATRDVPHTRLSSVLPQSVYHDGFRDIAVSSDGVLVQGSKITSQGAWEANWSYGRSQLSDEQIKANLGTNANGKAKQDHVHQVSLYWTSPNMHWRVGSSLLDSEFSYYPSDNEPFSLGEVSSQRITLALQYFSDKWEFSAEVIREFGETAGLYGPTFNRQSISEGGYVQFRYMFTPSLSLFAFQDLYDLNRNDRNGAQLEQGTGLPAYLGYMDSTALGMRIDLSDQWRLHVEHQWVQGAARLPGALNPQSQIEISPHWQMWSVQLMYWF